MRYKEGLHSILEGITIDVDNIASAIKNLENEIEKDNKNYTDKKVTIKRNDDKLCCKLFYNDYSIISEVTLLEIFNAVKGRILDDYEDIICNLIEENVIRKAFNSSL